MKHLTAIAAIIIAVFILIACTNRMESNKDISLEETTAATVTSTDAIDDFQQAPIPVPTSPLQQVNVTDSTTRSSGSMPQFIDWDKKIIKNGTIKFEVSKFDEFNRDVRNKIKKYGAYIGQEDNQQLEDRREASIQIKVPVLQFDDLMNELGTADSKQMERTIKTDDVTEQVVDTKSRLEAKKEMRLKYLEFLRQSKNMKEVLEVQAEINNIQEQIESAAGRIQFLNKNAAYSTIQIIFFQPIEGIKPAPEPDNSFFQKTSEAFGRGAGLVKGLLLVLISIWPLILVALGGWFIWRSKKQPVTVGVKQ